MMKNGLIVVNVILVIAVAILFYLHFDSKKTNSKSVEGSTQKDSAITDTSSGFKIGYFEMDSIENNLTIVRDVQKELDKKKDSINNILARIDRSIRDKANEYQAKAASMNQTQMEQARNDLEQRKQDFEVTKQQYDQDYRDLFTGKMQEVRGKIEQFLKVYNKDRKFSFIIAYDPGIIYYRDTMYNITGDVIKGVNALYKKKKN